MNPMFIGIIIGLLLGIGLALGLAIWLNRANNPFIEKARPIEALQTIPSKSSPATGGGQTSSTLAPSAAGKGESDKPRFEFYQILPGDKNDKSDKNDRSDKIDKFDKAGKADKSAKTDIARAVPTVRSSEPPKQNTAESKPAAKLDVKPGTGEIFQLQAGAFQSATDAENMKAKVAFAGFEATVRPVNVPDKGTLYRVRLGPYKSLDEVNRIKAALSQGGISAAVVKGSD